jgi:hypothetical protein
LHAAETRLVAYDQAAPPTESPVGIKRGTAPILITAPHAARHWRDGDWKQEDEYTTAIGDLLHHLLGAHFIYARYQLNPDPHDDGDDNVFKQTIGQFVQSTPVRLALDLHGARGDRDFAVALGTIGGRTFAPYEPGLIAAFAAHGFTPDAATSLDRLALNLPRYMGGAVLPTVTRYLWEQHCIPAAQIELTAWLRVVQRLPSATNARNGTSPDFRGDPVRIVRALSALYAFIRQVLDDSVGA